MIEWYTRNGGTVGFKVIDEQRSPAMTTENGKELGGHHCPDWDGLWVTPSSPDIVRAAAEIGRTNT